MSGDLPTPCGIPWELLERVFKQAREAFPAECCGWLTGAKGTNTVTALRPCDNAQSDGEHPTAADRSAE